VKAYNSQYALLKALTPSVTIPTDDAVQHRLWLYAREGSKGVLSGEHVLQTDLGGRVHILCVQSVAFRTDDWSHCDSVTACRPDSGQLVVIGTESQERFNSIDDAIAAIDQGVLTTMSGLASWDVPATATPRFLVYSTKGRE